MASAQSTYYVNASRPDNAGNGLSWATAFRDFQNGLDAATQDSGSNIDTVWVAGGTYKPTESPDNEGTGRNFSFHIYEDTEIYGGFAGNETDKNSRDWVNNPTILSGDFSGNDAATGRGKTLILSNIDNNAYHVLVTVNLSSSSIIDGFIIQGGNANEGTEFYNFHGQTLVFDNGGGMFNKNSAIKVNNSTFKNNYAFGEGGAMFNEEPDSAPARMGNLNNAKAVANGNPSPSINNCTFDKNNAFDGGAMFNADTSPIIDNSVFTDNHSRDNGGGIYNRNSSTLITNSTLVGNYALLSGGGMYSWIDSSPNLNNSIVWNNLADASDPNIKNALNPGFALTISFSDIQGSMGSGVSWLPGFGTDGTGNIDSDPKFINESDPDGADNIPRTADDGIALTVCSPAVNFGTNTGISNTDILANPRPYNAGTTDMGAYELQTAAGINIPTLVTVDKTAICLGSSVSLSATCATGTITWYTVASNGSAIGTGSPFSHSPTINTTYYAACQDGVCESTRVATSAVTVSNTLPTIIISGTDNLSCLLSSVTRTASGAQSYSWTNGLGNSATANISVPGTYTVTGTAANGCSATATTSVTQNIGIPTLTISGSDNLTCSITSVSRTASGAQSYSWSNGLGNFATANISTPGTYTVTGTATNGCTATTTTVVSQDINSPLLSISGSDNLTCSVTSVSRTASGAQSYSWSNGLGNNASVNISVAGTYTVTGTSINGCTSTASTSVTKTENIPSMSISSFTNPSACSLSDGSIIFSSTNLSDGNYTFNYRKNGIHNAQSIIVASNQFSLINLGDGTYNNFSITVGNCTGTSSESQILTEPSITVSASNTGPYSEGDLLELNATGGTSYQWTGPNGFVSSLQNPSIPNITLIHAGIYSVSVFTNVCSATATTAVSINNTGQASMKYELIFGGAEPEFISPIIQDMEFQLSDRRITIRATPITSSPVIVSTKLQLSGTLDPDVQYTIDSDSPFNLHELDNVSNGVILPHNYYTFIARGYDQTQAMGSLLVGDDVIRFWIILSANEIQTPILSNYNICVGTFLTVSAGTTGSFKPGNIFKAYLSDENGSFAFPTLIGSSGDASNIPCSIPNYLKSGNSYRIKVISSAPIVSSPFSVANLTIISPDIILQSPIDDLANVYKTEKAVNTIIARNSISGNSNIQYQASKSISLEPGFNSLSGTIFKAEIKDVCNN